MRKNIFYYKYIMTDFKLNVGSKAQVFHGTAKKTPGGVEKKGLMKNKHGRIVSKKQHKRGKKSLKYLIDSGYKTKKGVFGFVKKGRTKKNRSSKKK